MVVKKNLKMRMQVRNPIFKNKQKNESTKMDVIF